MNMQMILTLVFSFGGLLALIYVVLLLIFMWKSEAVDPAQFGYDDDLHPKE